MGRKSKCLYKCSVRGRGRRCEKKIHRSTSQKGSINLGGEGLRSLRRRERSGMGVTSFAIEDVQNHDEEACRSSEVKIGSLWTAKKSKTRGWCVLRDHCRTQTCPCYERPRLDLIKHPHWATLSTRGEKEANNIQGTPSLRSGALLFLLSSNYNVWFMSATLTSFEHCCTD